MDPSPVEQSPAGELRDTDTASSGRVILWGCVGTVGTYPTPGLLLSHPIDAESQHGFLDPALYSCLPACLPAWPELKLSISRRNEEQQVWHTPKLRSFCSNVRSMIRSNCCAHPR